MEQMDKASKEKKEFSLREITETIQLHSAHH